ncbi:MAG: DUF2752 domain-containing protein [Lachnospiraceae bacterium]|nr:DUF2752 domain-containing protein [Lachnospiraceae bacterium]
MGWLALGLGIAGALLLRSGVFDNIHGESLCAFRRATGYYCPGCGLTRSCFALARGRVLKSILYHPIPVYALFLYLIWMVRTSVCRITKKQDPASYAVLTARFYKRFEIAVFAGIGILLIQWLIKLLMQLVYGLDWFKWLNLA